jgi:Cupin domain
LGPQGQAVRASAGVYLDKDISAAPNEMLALGCAEHISLGLRVLSLGFVLQHHLADANAKDAQHHCRAEYSLAASLVPVGGRIPIHRHAQMDEVFYVVEGSGTFILNDARLSVEKGATVFIP